MSNIEIYPDSEGGWRFRIKAANHEIVAGGESYSTEQGAKEGIEALKRALGPKEEWGVRCDTVGGTGDIAYGHETYTKSNLREFLTQDRTEREAGVPEHMLLHPRLIQRLVTDWEEAGE